MLVRVLDKSYRDDKDLLEAMRVLIAPSYVGMPRMFEHDVELCDRLYLLVEAETLVAFFMVGFISIGDGTSPAIYLGLSAAAESHKNSGVVRTVFRRFTTDARSYQAEREQPVVMFGTLATPSSFFAVHTMWKDAQPSGDGEFRESERGIAQQAADWLGARVSPAHPFVLPEYAVGTRYSESERRRIARVCEKHDFGLFGTPCTDPVLDGARGVTQARGRERSVSA
jgi:hypothetical protein